MTLIPVVRCREMAEAVAFYTEVLDFKLKGTWPASGDPAFSILKRKGFEMHLSSHQGDGVYGQPVAVLTGDIHKLYRKLLERGLKLSGDENSPVSQRPTEQTWGNTEFYVKDPSGNTIRYIQR